MQKTKKVEKIPLKTVYKIRKYKYNIAKHATCDNEGKSKYGKICYLSEM